MCTVVILRRPGDRWPLLLAANRDERFARPWHPPARHWPDRPETLAGQDDTGGGTWLGVNDFGLVAGVLNRPGSLGPEDGKRSRGELPLEALDHAEAFLAAEALSELDPAAYRPFNLFIADNRDAYVLFSPGGGTRVAVETLPAGLSMITAHGLNAPDCPRTRLYQPQFAHADVPDPDPESENWAPWERLLASRLFDPDAGPTSAMNIDLPDGFGTCSSSLIALPSPERAGNRALWRFCPTRPGESAYEHLLR